MTEIDKIKTRLAEIESEKKHLLERLSILEKTINEEPLIYGSKTSLNNVVTTDEKIALFLKLFRCRKDVYPRLWESRSKGTTGYSPVCFNEWDRQYCRKPSIKCSDCTHQKFAPLDEKAAEKHLIGKETIGSYAIDQNDNAVFLAADFDKSSWQTDVIAYKKAALDIGIEVSVEISRSGKGAHGWIFFSKPIPAEKARQLGSIILSKAEKETTTLTLDSYDRFFPNQDFLPSGGYGNLIALPLQKERRKDETTEFVNTSFKPYEDQWEYLSATRRLSLKEVDTIIETFIEDIPDEIPKYQNTTEVHIAEKILKADLAGCPDYNETIEITIYNRIFISIKGIPEKIILAFKKIATFANPEFFIKQKNRLSTWQTPKYICCAELENGYISLPRGLLDEVVSFINGIGATPEIVDKRDMRDRIACTFEGTLYSYQKTASDEIIKHDLSVLVAPTGTGKTVIGVHLISLLKKPTLILVHRAELIDQWIETLTSFITEIERKHIGVLGAGRKKLKGVIDIGMIQTFSKKEDIEEISKTYDLIIIDECHHIPAVSFEAVLNSFSAHYFLGLTATPQRKDGNQAIIHMQCGPIRYEVADVNAIEQKRTVFLRETPANDILENSKLEIYKVWEYLCNDEMRNSSIANDIIKTIEEGRNPLILTDRKSHIELLNEELAKKISEEIQIYILTGELGKKARREILQNIKTGFEEKRSFCILATGSLIGEGFDLPDLDTMFLTMPISFKGRLIQFAGRLHRKNEENKEIEIYDYVDTTSGLTISMFKKRITAYKKMGYNLETKSYKLMKWL